MLSFTTTLKYIHTFRFYVLLQQSAENENHLMKLIKSKKCN